MAFRGAFRVDHLDDQRGQLALERLRLGHLVVVDGLGLRGEEGLLTITAVSDWSDPTRMTSAIANAEIARAEARWTALAHDHPELVALASEGCKLELVVDYDTGSVLVDSRAIA